MNKKLNKEQQKIDDKVLIFADEQQKINASQKKQDDSVEEFNELLNEMYNIAIKTGRFALFYRETNCKLRCFLFHNTILWIIVL